MPPGSTRRALTGLAGLAVVASVAMAVVDRGSVARIVCLVLGASCLLAATVGPLLRGARPLRLWMPQVFGCLALFVSLVTATAAGQFRLGAVKLSDGLFVVGIGLLVLWLILLSAEAGRDKATYTFLDLAAASISTFLVVWIALPFLLAGRPSTTRGFVIMLYPSIDVALLALLVHLGMRTRRAPTALRILVVTVAGQLLLDVVNVAIHLRGETERADSLALVFVLVYFGLAVAATHPSVVLLSQAGSRVDDRPTRPTARVVFWVSPAILATIAPTQGALDTVVRTTLVAALMALLFVHLTLTMRAVFAAEADSRELATHDPLTGLFTRSAMFTELEHLMAVGRLRGRSTAVLFIDCDDFKHVNDTWGHQVGDRLLVDLARRLPRHLRERDVLARHGGDEFVVLRRVADRHEAREAAEEIQRFFAGGLRLGPGTTHVVSPSIGVAVAHGDDGLDPEDLVGRADIAMYEAKRAGHGRIVVFDDDLAEEAALRASVGDRIGPALRDDCFDVELVPVRGGAGYARVVGWRAIPRWHDPALGVVSPEVFLPLAERLGLMDELGRFLLHRACQKFAIVRQSDPSPGLFVTTRREVLRRTDYVEDVRRILGVTGLAPGMLHIGVSEATLFDPGPIVSETLEALRALGVGAGVEGFGTGYAALETLVRIPFDCVLLDPTLVERIGADEGAPRQLGAVLDLVRSLGIERVVACGVRTAEQEAVLRRLGFPLVEGPRYATAAGGLGSHLAAAVLAATGRDGRPVS